VGTRGKLAAPELEAIEMRWSNGAVVVLVAVVAVAACQANDRAPEKGEANMAVNQSASPGLARRAAPAPMVSDVSGGLGTGGGAEQQPRMVVADTTAAPEPARPGAPSPSPATASAMIIRTGNATIKVDSLEPAVARLRILAQGLGGYVGNTSMQTGSDQLRSASVEIKVPAPRWGQLINGLKPVGTLEAVTESAEDVGEEFVDVQARVANAKRLEARLIDLLANRTGKLSDALQVERELARVREEIERYEGRIRYLRSQTSMSTMTVNVHEPLPVLGSHPGDNPIAQAFRDAWRIFVGVIAFLISSLGIIIPLGIIGWLAWRLLRGRVKGVK
jgi:Domain of unknown function (DUF4349)